VGVFQKNNPVMLGLDISSTSIKLIELSYRAKIYQVERYARCPLAPGVIQDGEIKNTEEVAQTLQALVQHTGTDLNHVAIALSGKGVVTKILSIRANHHQKAFERAILMEAQSILPFPINETNLDFQILGPSQDPGYVAVLLAASHSEKMNSLIEVLEMAGLTPLVVDIEMYALARSLKFLSHKFILGKQQEMVAMLDIGATKMALYVIHNFIPVFVREENIGITQLIDEMISQHSLTLAQALSVLGQENNTAGLAQMIDSFRERLVNRVMNLLQIFAGSEFDPQVQALILTGGGARLLKLAKMFEQQSGLSTFVADPFEQMVVTSKVETALLKADGPSLMICCGLAMRSFKS
jgi:type IV pilus assembly protein PilM